jgi:hypothetical protein
MVRSIHNRQHKITSTELELDLAIVTGDTCQPTPRGISWSAAPLFRPRPQPVAVCRSMALTLGVGARPFILHSDSARDGQK